MVTTQQKAISSASPVILVPTGTDAATQTELPKEHAAIQVSGCRVCPRFPLVSEASSENACERCAQVEERLLLVVEFWEEVNRLRSIQESEKVIDWWNHTLLSLDIYLAFPGALTRLWNWNNCLGNLERSQLTGR